MNLQVSVQLTILPLSILLELLQHSTNVGPGPQPGTIQRQLLPRESQQPLSGKLSLFALELLKGVFASVPPTSSPIPRLPHPSPIVSSLSSPVTTRRSLTAPYPTSKDINDWIPEYISPATIAQMNAALTKSYENIGRLDYIYVMQVTDPEDLDSSFRFKVGKSITPNARAETLSRGCYPVSYQAKKVDFIFSIFGKEGRDALNRMIHLHVASLALHRRRQASASNAVVILKEHDLRIIQREADVCTGVDCTKRHQEIFDFRDSGKHRRHTAKEIQDIVRYWIARYWIVSLDVSSLAETYPTSRDINEWIPKYVSDATKAEMRATLSKPYKFVGEPEYIYVMQVTDPQDLNSGCRFKVGKSKSPVKRANELSGTCHPVKYEVLRVHRSTTLESEDLSISGLKRMILLHVASLALHRRRQATANNAVVSLREHDLKIIQGEAYLCSGDRCSTRHKEIFDFGVACRDSHSGHVAQEIQDVVRYWIAFFDNLYAKRPGSHV